MKYRTGDDFDAGSRFLSLPGCYHMIVTYVRDPAATKDGAPIAGGLFSVGLAVLAGGDGNQRNKTLDLTFFEPSIDAKDGGKFQRKKIDRFLLAMSLVDEQAKDKDIDINLGVCAGRQLCVKLESRPYKDKQGREKEGLDIHFSDIYHVDDPEVATWTKCAKSLAAIKKQYRKIDGSANGGSTNTVREVASAPAPAASINEIPF